MILRLVLIACSNAKQKFLTPTPAIEVYDGPYFKTIRKLKREKRFPEDVKILVLSAKYGLLTLDDRIVAYDQKMTEARIQELQSGVITKLSNIIKSEGVSELLINLGSSYLKVLTGIEESIPKSCQVKYLFGTIVQRRKKMKEYLTNELS